MNIKELPELTLAYACASITYLIMPKSDKKELAQEPGSLGVKTEIKLNNVR